MAAYQQFKVSPLLKYILLELRHVHMEFLVQVHRSLHQFAAFLGFTSQPPQPSKSAHSIVSPSHPSGQLPAYQPITKDLVGDSTVYVRSHAQPTVLVHDASYETGIRLKEVAPAASQDPAALYIRRAPQPGHAPHAAKGQPHLYPTGDVGYSRQQPKSSGTMSSGVVTSAGVASGSLVARTASPASAPPQAPGALQPPSAPAPSLFPGAQHVMSASAQDIVGESTIYIRHAPQQLKEAPPRAVAPTNLIPLKLPGHCEGMPLFLEQVRFLGLGILETAHDLISYLLICCLLVGFVGLNRYLDFSTIFKFCNFLFQVDQNGQLNVLVQGPDNCIFTTWSLPPNEFQRFLLQGLLFSPQEVGSWLS